MSLTCKECNGTGLSLACTHCGGLAGNGCCPDPERGDCPTCVGQGIVDNLDDYAHPDMYGMDADPTQPGHDRVPSR